MIQIFRGTFSAAHFYHQTQWGPDKNLSEFGKCFSQFGHGHDYRIELTLSFDEPVAVLGQILSIQEIFSEILNKLDHHHLNFMIPEFRKQIPTTENLALYIQDQLLLELAKLKASPKIQILKTRLYETADLWVEITAQETFSKI